jgi:ectoine hydroxylase-related dioxygenase (phytanoyl-CoA dioxygenase family)
MSRYTKEELDSLAEEFDSNGFVVLPGLLPKEKLIRWREAFDNLLDERVRSGSTAVRGANRHYITLPFRPPFADESIFADPDLLGVIELVAGDDPVMCQLATDTPLNGSDYQDIHRDTPALFENFAETPSFQLAVNFPLCEVTLENGPLETTFGAHRMHAPDALAAYEKGKLPLKAITMKMGDVMIRDVRGLHRGTPNRTAEPRPMVVIGYSRSWYFRPEVHIDVPEPVYASLGSRARRLLRTMPQVAGEEPDGGGETYTKFAY